MLRLIHFNVSSCPLIPILVLLILTFNVSGLAGQEERSRDRQSLRRLINRVGSLSPTLKEHVDELSDEGESESELVEICEEFLSEYELIKSEHGAKSARLWCKLVAAEFEVEKAIGLIEEEELDESELKHRMLKLIDAEISFEAEVIRQLDDAEERAEQLKELEYRRGSRDEELAEAMAEILEGVEGEGDEWGEDPELAERLKKDLADYQPVQPVKLSDSEIAAASRWDFDLKVLPVLNSACFDCHGGGSRDGNLDIESLLKQLPLVKNRERWRHVIAQIENRTMPPPNTIEVSDEDRKLLSAWMRDQLENFDFTSIKNPGFESAKRLSHEEYNNTIRDLIGIDLRPADQLPADLSTSRGFDNSSNSLFLNDGLLERYFGLAEFVVQKAFPLKNRNEAQQRAWEKLFVVERPTGRSQENDAVSSVMKAYLARAYRSPVATDDVEAMVSRFESYRADGLGYEEAVLKCVQISLVSPRFLLHVESQPEGKSEFQVDPFALANRLSYFLWASMPDQRLFQLAESGDLASPETIRAEVQRMLADARAETLGASFAGQWLGFEHLGSRIRLDPIDNPWCTDSLMDSMKAETALFFVSLIRDNRPLSELIDADYTFLNEELAQFYGIENVRGSNMKRVSLKTKLRGGILSQGSILAVTSFPDRTSPVTRGAWVLTNVLGNRPPNPPPNASQLNDEIESADSLTPRQKMEHHRLNPNCAACHDQIDPLGFALENYDLFGRYRTRYGGRKIDAESVLQDGTKIAGPIGLKEYLVEQKQKEVLVQLTRKLLAYALGRQLEYYDEAAVQKIVANVVSDDWRMQTLILEIVKSYPFQFKQVPEKHQVQSETEDSNG